VDIHCGIGWRYPSGGTVIADTAVVNGTVYWGSGYYYPENADNDTFYTFAVR